jgi:hypothetical protein
VLGEAAAHAPRYDENAAIATVTAGLDALHAQPNLQARQQGSWWSGMNGTPSPDGGTL